MDLKEVNEINESADVDDNRFLIFLLGEEVYAMPLLDVREVIAVPETTPVPNSPKHFNGIMNLRGQVISIFDLRVKLGIKAKEDDTENAVIIIDINSINIGITVDSVESVQLLKKAEISEAPKLDKNNVNKYLYGVARKDEKLILLIDLKKVLDVEDLNKLKSN